MSSERRLFELSLAWVRGKKVWGAAAVFASGILLAEVNLLAARNYGRYDASQDRRFTLSEPTRRLLESLEAPVTVTVLLPRAHPLLSDVRQSLVAYQALSPLIQAHYLDPEEDTAAFLAFSKKAALEADTLSGAGAEGAAVVVESDGHTWLVRETELAHLTEGGQVVTIEAPITEAIAQARSTERQRVCFFTGHGELSIDDVAPSGLRELGKRLERSNLEPERVPLDVPDPRQNVTGCDALAIVGPTRPWPPEHAQLVAEKIRNGTPALFFLDPIVAENGRVMDPGLGPALEAAGATLEPGFILEQSAEHRLPSGVGEAFFAVVKNHPITAGLSTDSARLDSRVLLAGVQPLRALAGTSTNSLLVTTAEARVICDLNDPERTACSGPEERRPPFLVALSQQRALSANAKIRAVAVGTTSLAQNRSFTDPSAYGARLFVENAFAWALERPAPVSVPERSTNVNPVHLTEESLSSLLRYVLIYLPLFVVFSGGFILMRRHRRQEHSREESA